jgi:hypothetical protein
MASEKPTRRKPPISCERDPRTYVASGCATYVEQFYPGSWYRVFKCTGWRPDRPARSELDAEAIRYLQNYLSNGKPSGGK